MLLVFSLYRRWVSPLLHSVSGVSGACRFQPTCSEYAVVAVSRYGVLYGVALALWRLLRCHPFARGGFDPVPGTYPVAPLPPSSLPRFPVGFREFPELHAPFLKRKAHTRSCPELRAGNSGCRTDDPGHLP